MKKINLLETFFLNAEKNPSKPAIIDQNGQRTTSQQELMEKTKRMAHYLQSQPISPHSFIAIRLPKSVDFIIAEFGCWMSGHAIVPISEHYPQERVDYILQHSKSPILITEEVMKEAMKCTPTAQVQLVEPDTDATLFFTSGSMGTPKGIVHSYAAIDIAIRHHGTALGMNGDSVFGCGAPFYFVAFLLYLHCLHNNGTVHIFDDRLMKDVQMLKDYINAQQINMAFISPAILRHCGELPQGLKTVFAASEKLSGVDPKGYRLFNLYGMTETCALATMFEVDRAYDNTPIGKAVNTCKVSIRNEEGHVLPAGSEGEICLEGTFAKGYFEDEEKTAELYRGGVLHTGDLGVELPDGNIQYVNRKDWMVKINGQRVEPGEVETVIKGLKEVKETVVKGFTSDTGSQYLCAYYTSTVPLEEEQIRQQLEHFLPAYMVPAFIVRLEEFPINPNGKTDRKALLPPDRSTLRATYTAPETALQQQLCEAYEKVLKVDRIGLDDDFLHLGGDSIRVVMLQQLCHELPLSAQMIFSARTPRHLAERCEQYQDNNLAKLDYYPLSQAQLGIYAACMNRPEEAAYNNARLFRLPLETPVDRVLEAIHTTLAAHPYLNTRISLNEKEEPQQTRPATLDFQPTVEYLDEEEFQRLKAQLIQPFHLLQDPLFRIRLFQTEKGLYLFMDFHHLIFDGASFEILVEDLNSAFTNEELEPETYTACEVAQEEALNRESDRYNVARKWFQEQFGNLDLDTLPLPDKKGKKICFEKSALRGFDYDALQRCCETEHITMNVLTTAAFGYLLGVYANTQESLFATIYNGRTDLRTNRTMAMMVKTLPVYCHWNEMTTTHDYLQQVKSLMLNTMQHDIYSFAEQVAENSCITSEMLFVYQGNLTSPAELFGMPCTDLPLLENATGEKLAFQLFLLPDNQLELKAEYQAQLYSAGFIQRLMECYRQVLKELVSQSLMKAISPLPQSQIKELDSFNPTPIPYDQQQTIVSLFRKAAERYPEQKALVFNEEVITYREANELTDRIAQHLAAHHIGRGDVVSILIPRSTYMATASIGVLKTAACYEPLDPTYPAERLNFMMQDANAKYLITTHELREVVNEYTGPVLYLEDIPNLSPTGQALPEPLPEDRFTLLYTSGTTGLPKGCQLTQANMVAFCHWYHHYYALTSHDCVGAYASYGFDANMMDMYPALTLGATCCIVGEDVRLDLVALSDYLSRNHVTHMFITTQVGRQFALDFPTHPTLRHLSVGGEALVPLTPPTSYKLHNAYGPTECTIISSIYPVEQLDECMSIGRPIGHLRLYVVDRWGHRVPVGALGELRMAGNQVSEGYLHRPEQTEKVFIPNPFATTSEDRRMYCSGDIVRYRADGNLEFIGRRDNQVKIRGFRIELTEVEAVVRQYPGIEDATVAAFDDPNGGKFIAAYVVAEEPVDIAALNAFILEQKPPYMVPAVTMQIDQIPLNQNMKVNRRALPTPEIRLQEEDGGNRIPNVLEEQLQSLIGGIVHMEKLPFNTALSYLGLTSISSIKLSAALYKTFGVSIASKLLIKGATLLSLENEMLRQWMQGGAGQSRHTPDNAETLDASPLTYSQQGVYYDCMKRPTEMVYNIPALLSFPAETDPDDLERAVRTVMDAHPALQCHFEMRDKEVMQIRDHFDIQMERVVLSEAELETFKREFVKPFNLAKPPLFHLTLVQTEKRKGLLLDFHHLIFDGASLDLFVQELVELLEGREITAESYSYFDYSADEREAEKSERYQRNHDFFHRMLSTCDSASEMPADLGGRAENGGLQEVAHPIGYAQMERCCHRLHTTPAALCLAAAFYTVARYANSKEVYISTISNGRSDVRISDTFGMFVKTLPLGIHIKEQKVGDFIAESGQLLADTVEHEVYPFARISNEYKFSPTIVYAYQLGVLNTWSVNGRPLDIEGLELHMAKFHLSIHIEEHAGQPSIVLQYNDALYSRPLMESFATSMAQVLKEMMAHPEEQVKRLSMLDPERARQVRGFRHTGDAHTGLYHEGIERQALLHPDKVAVVATDAALTYGEFNARANRIAHALMARGVKRGDRVALLLPRDSRVLLSMFGVMKSGAAYIPCDPEYPVERIHHILSDSGAACIVTTSERLGDFEPGKAVDVDTLLQHADGSNPHSGVTPDDLVYLIYTSGSTGKPKGVMLRHAGITNYLTADPQNVHVHALVTEAHSFLSVTTVSFDMSLKEIGTTLYNGLTLVFANEQQANNPILLAELFRQTHADAFNATPSRMMQYIELPEFREALGGCRVIMCGGEKYPDQLLVRLREITAARIFNTYGPTEITVSSNGKELTHSDIVTIGRPLLNYQEFVVDTDGNELPPHVVGELYIGGVGVARGYQNLEKMTAERFVDYQGIRVYRSGDYARWTADGEIVILGRTDTQVKLRGLRIELGEVESCMLKYPGIRNAVVTIRKINRTEHLCAYFTAETEIGINALKEALKTTLAQYMVPTAYQQMEALPLTPNGKTDLKALPEPQLLSMSEGEAPANATEATFCDIFARILQLDKIGATDNFFEMGGTSLSVASIIIDASRAGYTVAYGDVFAHPTPRALAALFLKDEEKALPDPEISDYNYDKLVPLLESNNIEAFRKGERQEIGNVLVTGATGFLGVHILHTLITQETGKIYCLLRGKKELQALSRLKTTLFYYFENAYDDLFGKRLFVVEGDITSPASLRPLEALQIDTVFHCAANVKHFAADDQIERVNVGGVKTLLDFCEKTGARLVHTSTMSVGGVVPPDHPKLDAGLTERDFYFGQLLSNKYVRSKFLAERLILDSVLAGKVSAKIMRVGNLSARSTDGEFQINFTTNTFMGRLKSYRIIGQCAYDVLDSPLEFSPIDEVAKAIIALATTPRACCVFHPFNHHFMLLGDVLSLMSGMGLHIRPVEAEVYQRTLAEAEADPEKAKILSSMIAYQNMGGKQVVVPMRKNNTYTMQILYRLGYHWPITSWDYVNRFLKSISELGFFDEREE